MKILTYCCILLACVFCVAQEPVKKVVRVKLPETWKKAPAQERLKALRVAQINAYRALLERVNGFQLIAGTSINDCVLESDMISNSLNQDLRGATELGIPKFDNNGMVKVTYAVKLKKLLDALKKEKTLGVDKNIDYQDKVIEADGLGALPGSVGMQRLRARRAAELDAYRLMAERLVGVRINSSTSVADLCLKSDKIKTSLIAFLRGIKPISESYEEDNSCSIVMQLKIREVIKTVEELVRRYNSGEEDKISNVKVSTNDIIFKVTGNGAPRDETMSVPITDMYRNARNVFRQVLKKTVVIE